MKELFKARIILLQDGWLCFVTNPQEWRNDDGSDFDPITAPGAVDVTDLLIADPVIRELWYRNQVATRMFDVIPWGSEIDDFGNFRNKEILIPLMEECIAKKYPYVQRCADPKNWDTADYDGENWYYLFPEVYTDPLCLRMKAIWEDIEVLKQDMDQFYDAEVSL